MGPRTAPRNFHQEKEGKSEQKEQHVTKARFFRLHTVDTWGQNVLCYGWGRPGHWRVLGASLRPRPPPLLHTRSTRNPCLHSQKCLQTWPNVLRG